MFTYKVNWNYPLSSKLSEHLNAYKVDREMEYLDPPKILARGKITTTDVLNKSTNEKECQNVIINWGQEVYQAWINHHEKVDGIATGFLKKQKLN